MSGKSNVKQIHNNYDCYLISQKYNDNCRYIFYLYFLELTVQKR